MNIVTLRTSAIAAFSAALLGAGMLAAQDFSPGAMDKAFPYKDLPGVQSPEKAKEPEDPARCTQEVRMRSALRRDLYASDSPGMVYRCEKDGIVIESARPPLRKYWNPLDEQ